MRFGGSRANDKEIGCVTDASQVDQNDVEGLRVVQRVDDEPKTGVLVNGGCGFGFYDFGS
jgi:hypothetical protein